MSHGSVRFLVTITLHSYPHSTGRNRSSWIGCLCWCLTCFLTRGFEPVGEDGGSRGRADMALRFNGQAYLFEFKVVDRGPEGTAPEQLKARGHADKYRDLGLPIHLIGMEFSREERNIVAFPVEAA